MTSNRFFIMHSTMIMRRTPSTQQSRTKLRTIPLTSKLTASPLNAKKKKKIMTEVDNTLLMDFNAFGIITNFCKKIFFLQMICCTASDNSRVFLGCQVQKTFFSNHPSSLKNVLRDNLVELFEPESLLKDYMWI